MNKRLMALAALAAIPLPASAQEIAPANPDAAPAYLPRMTSWGAPDLQGYWSNTSLTGMQRPAASEKVIVSEREASLLARRNAYTGAVSQESRPSKVDEASSEKLLSDKNPSRAYNRFWMDPGASYAQIRGEYRTAWITDPPDGMIPYRGEVAPRPQNFDGPEVRPQSERCLMSFTGSAGPVLNNGLYNNTYQIVQTPTSVMVLTEMIHDVRIIPIGGAHGPAEIPKWGGDSVGHYEDQTLVVETVNAHPKQRSYISPAGKVTERFTRSDDGQILYQFKVEDPALYTAAWSGEMVLNSSAQPLYEYACHEGNYALPSILAGAREMERTGRPQQAIKRYARDVDVSEGQ